MRIPIRGTPDDWFAWLTGADAERRKEATLILGGLEPDDPVAPEPLAERLPSSDEDVVFWALIGLARLEHRAGGALPALRAVAAGHAAVGVRQAALDALAQVAPADAGAKATMLEALGDPSPWVRQTALRALIAVPGLREADLAAIRALEADADTNVVSQVEITLRNLRARGAPAA